MNKILDDLAEYKKLQDAGCKIPPVVAATLEQYKDVKRPGIVCGYCGEEVKSSSDMHNSRQCETCYKFYNYFNVLYYGPKRPDAVRTRRTYRSMLMEIAERRDAGLKIPGVAVGALLEEAYTLKRLKEVKTNDSSVETRTERVHETNPSIRRRSESIS